MENPNVEKKEKKMFEMFEPGGKQAWLETVAKDLPGSEFEKTLVWKTDDGFDIQPMYFAEDIEDIEHEGFTPGKAPFVRGTSNLENKEAFWTVSQIVATPDVKQANKEIVSALGRGQTGAHLIIDINASDSKAEVSDSGASEQSGIKIGDADTLATLLDGVDARSCELTFDAGNATPVLPAMLRNMLMTRGVKTEVVRAVFTFDPLSRLAQDGRLPLSMRDTFNLCEQTVRYTRQHFPDGRCITVDGRVFHNSGASGSDEVALALSCGAEYVRELLKRDVEVRDIAASLRFSFAAGTDFFPEIAKFRAARMLWAKIMYHFAAEQKTSTAEEESLKMEMHISASQWHQTAFDPYVNILRGTIEAMSAALGGGRSITTLPFNSACGATNTLSGRLAGNTQIILQEEAYLTEVVDPSAGSYYIETLTDNIARRAWSRFREIEKNGGYVASLKNGTIQQILEETAETKQQRVADFSDVLVGTNKYRNPEELRVRKIDEETGPITASETKSAAEERDLVAVQQALGGITRENPDSLLTSAAAAAASGATAGEIYSRLISIFEQGNVEVRPIPRMRLSEEFERAQAKEGGDREDGNV